MLEQTDRGVGDILTDISRNLERLVRGEIKLAKLSALEWVRGRARGAALVVIGAMVSLLAVGLLLLGAVARLAETMRPWRAALLVAAGTGAVSVLIIAIGLTLLRRRSLKSGIDVSYEDGVEWKTLPRS